MQIHTPQVADPLALEAVPLEPSGAGPEAHGVTMIAGAAGLDRRLVVPSLHLPLPEETSGGMSTEAIVAGPLSGTSTRTIHTPPGCATGRRHRRGCGIHLRQGVEACDLLHTRADMMNHDPVSPGKSPTLCV
jgi:hypothetical protein